MQIGGRRGWGNSGGEDHVHSSKKTSNLKGSRGIYGGRKRENLIYL